MTLDTENTIYLCTDSQNGAVHLLVPHNLKAVDVATLHIDDPDPQSTDAAEFRLLRDEMDETTADL